MKRDLRSFLPKFVWDVMATYGADTSGLELFLDPDGVPVQSAESIGVWVGDRLLRAPMLVFPDLVEAVSQTAAHFARIPVRTNDIEREGEG